MQTGFFFISMHNFFEIFSELGVFAILINNIIIKFMCWNAYAFHLQLSRVLMANAFRRQNINATLFRWSDMVG